MPLKNLFRLLSILFLSGCVNNQMKQPKVTADTVNKNAAVPKPSTDFAIVIKDATLNLKAWEHETRLTELLGKPNSESTKILGEGADTHMGSAIRTTEYNGLKIAIKEILTSSFEENLITEIILLKNMLLLLL